jgi:hypothetical protein
MNPIKAALRALRPQSGFTYVMDSTLWECDRCTERVPFTGRGRHAESCRAREDPSEANDLHGSDRGHGGQHDA